MKDFYSAYQNDRIVTQAVSPCGQNVATLSTNEQISIWHLFEKRRVDLSQDKSFLIFEQDDDNRAKEMQGETDEAVLRSRLERLDRQLV